MGELTDILALLHPQDVALLGVVDVLRVMPQHPDLEGDRMDLRQRLPAKEPPCSAG